MRDDPAPHWRRAIEDALRPSGRIVSADVIDELASHVSDVYDAERQEGGSHASALAAADRVLRAATYGELHVTMRAVSAPSRLFERRPFSARRWLSDVGFDLRYAWRTMRREIAFSVSVIVILAAGIGATTAAWTVLDAVLFRPLPYPSSSSLIVLRHATPTSDSRAFAPADWLDYAGRHRHEVLLAAYTSC